MSEVVFRGYLYKSPPESFGSSLKPWRQRWLEYYASEQFADQLDEPKGVIDLKDCTEVVDRHPMKGYDHVFDLCTDKRAYHFAAPSIEIKSVWVESLTAVLRNKTEGVRMDPNVFLRMGVGNNAGDISVNSPIYSSLHHPNTPENSSTETTEHRHERTINNGSAPQPVRALPNATYFDNNLQDDYQRLQHHKPNDENPPPIKPGASANYDSIARPSLQDNNVDDYQRLDHKKYNQNGTTAPTTSTSTSLYSCLNRTQDDNQNGATAPTTSSSTYGRLNRIQDDNQNGATAPTSTSTYGRLNRTQDDNYHHLNHRLATIGSTAAAYNSLSSEDMRDDYQHLDLCTVRRPRNNKGEYQNANKYATIGGNYSQPSVPPIPVRKHKYENTTLPFTTYK